MNRKAQLTALDRLFLLAERCDSPLDFGVVLSPAKPIDPLRLKLGGAAARATYPKSGQRLTRDGWTQCNFDDTIVETNEPVANLVNRPGGSLGAAAVQQWVKETPGAGQQIVTRFHHAACDGFSAALWLNHQFAACSRLNWSRGGFTGQHSGEPRLLSVPKASVGRRLEEPSASLWCRRDGASGWRHWSTFELPASDLRRSAGRLGLRFNDLLAGSCAGALSRWNILHGAPEKPIRLWIPVNIRQRPAAGFGNGTSRIRIECGPPESPLLSRCRYIRRQILRALREGEWGLPPLGWLTWLPWSLQRLLVRWHLSRPGVDMGTCIFSHFDAEGSAGAAWPEFERIECIGPLPCAYPVAINCASLRERSWCTLTYDPARLSLEDIQCIQSLIVEETSRALFESSTARQSETRSGRRPIASCVA